MIGLKLAEIAQNEDDEFSYSLAINKFGMICWGSESDIYFTHFYLNSQIRSIKVFVLFFFE